MRTQALLLLSFSLCGCNLLHRDSSSGEAGTVSPDPLPTVAATTAAPVQATTSNEKGDEAGARALLTKFLAPGADYAALSKPLRPTKADYSALFDAPTAAKLQPAYDEHWDKEPMVIAPKA